MIMILFLANRRVNSPQWWSREGCSTCDASIAFGIRNHASTNLCASRQW